jgi:16S rRNA (guanine966-N2)-methyltransferase
VRIVAGRWRGRRIEAPPDQRVRPTAERVREAWMSIVQRWLPGARVLDLFAGSGALGLEALSRGAVSADFVEIHPRSLRALADNIETLGAGEAAVVHRADALRFIEPLGAGAYDVGFADPPYRLGMAERVARSWLAVPFSRILGVEHAVGEMMPEGADVRKYGSTSISFYQL